MPIHILQCKGFTSEEERSKHVSRNIFTFGGVSAFKRTDDCDLVVFDAPRVVHGADLRVPPSADADETGARCGVTLGTGVVARRVDVDAGRAEARGRLELAAAGESAPLSTARERGKAFEAEVRNMVSSVWGQPGVVQ